MVGEKDVFSKTIPFKFTNRSQGACVSATRSNARPGDLNAVHLKFKKAASDEKYPRNACRQRPHKRLMLFV